MTRTIGAIFEQRLSSLALKVSSVGALMISSGK